jgi:hypothetical protein
MLYQALRSGGLKSLKVGSRRLMTIEALGEWLHLHAVDS